MPKTFELSSRATTFATRPFGAEMRLEARTLLGRDRRLVLDCSNVLAVSYSFADEFAGKLTQGERDLPPIDVSIVNASCDVSAVIERAIVRRRPNEDTLSLV